MADNSFSFLKLILAILDFKVKARATFEQVKSDSELKQRSKMFGVHSIWFTIAMLAVICAGVASVVWIVSILNQDAIMVVIGLIILLIFLIVLTIWGGSYLIIASLTCWIYQLRLNKKAIGWVAMALFFVAIAGIATVTIIMLNKF